MVDRCFEVVIVGADEAGPRDAVVINTLAKLLKMDEPATAKLLESGTVVVRRQLSESEAQTLRDELRKIGLRSTYRLSSDGIGKLQLVPKDDTSGQMRIHNCPDCGLGIEFAAGEALPQQCPGCGVVFSKHERLIEEEAECERIVRQLLGTAARQELESAQTVSGAQEGSPPPPGTTGRKPGVPQRFPNRQRRIALAVGIFVLVLIGALIGARFLQDPELPPERISGKGEVRR